MAIEPIARLFNRHVRFVAIEDEKDQDNSFVRVAVAESGTGPEHLRDENLPLLVIPAEELAARAASNQIVVGVEGADRQMSRAVGDLLSPGASRIALIHVTWLPGIVSSPLGPEGIDNPLPQDLLAYHGARAALVGTADELRGMGFDISTHLREDRDPAVPIGRLCEALAAELLVLGLGHHGEGIGRRLSHNVAIPTLYVRAR